jgi:hypothetical protein
MLQDESVDAYDIYQSLNENQKEEVLKELYEMDNDMGSYGDGDIETSRENLEILLEGAKNGKKYSELPPNYANGGKVDISEFSVSDKKLFQCLISVLNSVHDLVGNDNVIDRFIDTHNNKYVFLIKNNESNTELQEQLSYNIMVMSECRDYLDYSGVRFENNILTIPVKIDLKKFANGGGISEDIYAISAVRESDKQVDIISTHKTYKAASNKLDKMFKNGEANFDVYETWRVRKLSESNEYKNGGSVNKYKYIPNYMVESVEVERNGKTTEIDGDKILDGLYVKGKTKFDNGGGVGNIRDFDNKMALINLDMIHEYAVKLDEIVTDESELEEWVKMKLTRVEQNVADVKHSLVGWDKFEGGGMIFKKQLLHIVTYAKDLINMIKAGSKLMSWQEDKLAISADNIDGICHHINYLYKKQADKFDKYIGDKYANGGNVGRDLLFKSKQPHEQRYKRKREWKEYKKEGWLDSMFANGGGV